MGTVVADMSMSLDGFVADLGDGVDRVFAWYGKPQPASQPAEGPSEPGAAGLRVIVAGRRTFNTAGGWDGRHPTGVPVIVVTHQVPDGCPAQAGRCRSKPAASRPPCAQPAKSPGTA